MIVVPIATLIVLGIVAIVALVFALLEAVERRR